MVTISSATSGNWEDGSTWSGGVAPTVGQDVQINDGDVITINASADVGSGSITNGIYINNGTLKFNRSNDITLQVSGRLFGDSEGILDMGTEGDPCLGNIEIQLNKTAIADVGLYFHQAFQCYMFGKVRTTNTMLIADAISSDTTITVEDATGWEAGDELVIATIHNRNSPQNVIIDSVTPVSGGYEIELTGTLGMTGYIECPVGNKTKNIVFTEHANANQDTPARLILNFSNGADYQIQHVRFHNLGSNSTTIQGGVNFDSANGNTSFVLKHICITNSTGSSQRGLDINNYRDSTGIYDNFLFDCDGGDYFMRCRTGATINLTNSVFYKGGQISSSYSQGSSGMNFENCKFFNRGADPAISITGVSVGFKDCLIMNNSNDSRGIYVSDVGLLTIDNCTFGRIDGDYNLTFTRGIDSGGSGYQQNIECDTNDYSACTLPIDFEGGAGGFESCSNTSYMTDINFDNSGFNRVYKPMGSKIQDNTYFVLGTHAVKFPSTDNTTNLTQIYTSVIPSDLDCVVSGFFRVESGFVGSPKPTITVTSPSGINESVTFSGADDTWVSFEIPITQTSGSDERITLTYTQVGDSGDIGYLDSLMITAYGTTNIESRDLAVSNKTTVLVGALVANPLITQDETTASSHTGISITESPVTWNSKDFEITITGNLTTNPSLTLEDIQHYLYYNFNKIDAFEGRVSGFKWDNILPVGDDETYTFNSEGVRVIDENGDAFPGVTRMQSNDGSYYVSPVLRNLTTSGLFANSRVQVYNVTTDTELFNTTYAADLNIEYEEGVDITTGDTIRFRITYANGTSYKTPLELFSVASSGGTSVLISQTDWADVNSLSIDGSTVTEYSTDFANIQVDIEDSDNQTTKKRLVAWYAYTIYNSSQSIADYFGGITVEDISNYRVNVDIVNLKLENVKTDPLIFTDTDTRLYTSDGSTLFASSGGSIFMDSGKVYQLNVNVDEVQSVVDTINNTVNTIDTKVDVIDTNVDSLLTNVTTIDTNIDNLIVTTDSIETKIDTTLTNIATSDGKIDVLDNKVDILDTNIDGLIISTGVIDTNIDTTLTNLATIESKIDIIDTNVDTSLVDLTSLDTLIDVLTSNLSVVDGKIDVIDTEINGIETTVEASNSKIIDLAKTLLNRSKIDTINNTLIVYEDNGVDIAFVFDLKDSNSVATSTKIYERVPR